MNWVNWSPRNLSSWQSFGLIDLTHPRYQRCTIMAKIYCKDEFFTTKGNSPITNASVILCWGRTPVLKNQPRRHSNSRRADQTKADYTLEANRIFFPPSIRRRRFSCRLQRAGFTFPFHFLTALLPTRYLYVQYISDLLWWHGIIPGRRTSLLLARFTTVYKVSVKTTLSRRSDARSHNPTLALFLSVWKEVTSMKEKHPSPT